MPSFSVNECSLFGIDPRAPMTIGTTNVFFFSIRESSTFNLEYLLIFSYFIIIIIISLDKRTDSSTKNSMNQTICSSNKSTNNYSKI